MQIEDAGSPLIYNNALIGVKTGYFALQNTKGYNSHVKIFPKLQFINEYVQGQINIVANIGCIVDTNKVFDKDKVS